MKTKHKFKRMKHDVIWYHVFYTLYELYENFYYDDKMFNEMLSNLLEYAESKISPPDDSGDIVDRYVIVEYENENRHPLSELFDEKRDRQKIK